MRDTLGAITNLPEESVPDWFKPYKEVAMVYLPQVVQLIHALSAEQTVGKTVQNLINFLFKLLKNLN